MQSFIFLCSFTFVRLFLESSPLSPCFAIFHLKRHPRSNSTFVLGGCGIQFHQNKQKGFFKYNLVESVKDWRSEWFYAGNMNLPLVVHSNAGPIMNDRWEKLPLSSEDLKKIEPFLERIKVLKQQGLTGFGIVASFLCRRV
jgi:hypothetical protein